MGLLLTPYLSLISIGFMDLPFSIISSKRLIRPNDEGCVSELLKGPVPFSR